MAQPPSLPINGKDRSNRELVILHAIAEALNREIDLHSALQVALGQVVELFDLRTGWVFLIDEETEEPYLAAYQVLPPALSENQMRMQGSCYCLDTYRDGTMGGAANVNIITCTRLKELVDGTDGLRYHASIPLYASGKKLGILNVVSPDWREISPHDLHLLYTVGEMVSMAIQRARLFAKSTELGALGERNRLARELHDTLAQGLTAIVLQLETADVFLENPETAERAQSVVLKALNLARTNLEEVRRSVLDLRAAPLEGRTLAEALQVMVDTINYEGNIKVHFDGEGANLSLPSRIASALYRIAQESMNNVLQHAHAENAYLQLEVTAEHIHLTVEDDGEGFDTATMQQNRYGLVGLQERAKMLGGTFRLRTSPHEGTRLDIRIPLNG